MTVISLLYIKHLMYYHKIHEFMSLNRGNISLYSL